MRIYAYCCTTVNRQFVIWYTLNTACPIGDNTVVDLDKYKLFCLRTGIRRSTIDCRLSLYNSIKNELGLFTEQNINRYLGGLKERGCSNGYINLVVALVRSICACEGLDWGKNVKYWKSTTTERLTLSEAEISQFLTADCYTKSSVKEK